LTLKGSTSHEWSQNCFSRNTQIDLPVAHQTKIFEGVCVGELCAIKERGGKNLPGLELKNITSDY
jgi:hypothetical protein